MTRAHRTLALLAALALAAPAAAEVEDNVQGLATMRAEIMRNLRGDLNTVGPWNLKYVGPLPEGAIVYLDALPKAAFMTKWTQHDGFEVRLKKPEALFTKITKELRPIGVAITKVYESPGEGRVYVTFNNKRGGILELEKLYKQGLIRSIDWTDKEAASFVGYVGDEAAFERSAGHEDTPIRVRLTVREEGRFYTFSEYLPRTGPSGRDLRPDTEPW